ncbi:MAG: hypothetical protein ACKVP7_08825 [Hyphomicrobiaceae bacterium]
MISTPQSSDVATRPVYTIATLVNDPAQHAAMCASFRTNGFSEPQCEFVATANPRSAYAALNDMLAAAHGRYVILCHQDVRLLGDDRAVLDSRLAALEALDPAWAVAGNAGGVGPGRLAMRISDPHGDNQHVGPLPARVQSLDENFLVVKAQARVGFSRNLTGFHLYGADICLAADIMGYTAYVIDFHLRHLSPGRKDQSFRHAEADFRAKWAAALRPRWLQTTCTLLRLGAPAPERWLGRTLERPYSSLLRRTRWSHPASAAKRPGQNQR